jgi:hypothetical protein
MISSSNGAFGEALKAHRAQEEAASVSYADRQVLKTGRLALVLHAGTRTIFYALFVKGGVCLQFHSGE